MGQVRPAHYGPHATVVARVRPESEAASEELKGLFEEKTGILECAGLRKPEAARLVAALVRNRSCSWASLRASLAGYPALLAQVPDRPGPGGRPDPGLPTLAVRKGRRVLRQGTFAGSQDVKA